MFSKRQTYRKLHTHHVSHSRNFARTQEQSHAHHATHAHAHHAHTHHTFLYIMAYICTYCDRQGHLAKFCYDKLNASNSYIWVRKTNILGPKKVWVLKSTPILHNIGTHQCSKT